MKRFMNGNYPTTLGSLMNTVLDDFDTLLKPTVYFNDWTPTKYDKFNENEKDLTLELDIPGFELEDIKIEFKEQEQLGYHRVLISAKNLKREFSQTVLTPTNFDTDKVVAKYKNGVLTITAPKNKKTKNIKTIEVSAN